MDAFNLRDWRRERKLTQAALAELLDVSKLTIINWEQGSTTPPGRIVELACKALESEK